jgi:hypothetical protein
MGLRWSRANVIQDYAARLHSSAAAVKSVDSDLGFLAAQSAEEMQHYIATRGTAASGHSGRVDTGDMINDVGYRKNPHGGSTVFSWEFGWIHGFEKYYSYQERGFEQTYAGFIGDNGEFIAVRKPGDRVPGMYALRDASTTARDRLHVIGREIIAKAARFIAGGK